LQERTDVIASSAHLVFHQLEIGDVSALPPETSIIQAYDRAQRGLLILGAPGAGKTTLLLELVRELLQRAEHDPDQPLTIILNLSSWAKTRLPLPEWLAKQCSLVYGIPKPLCTAWIAQEQVQFLLDGLDEMEVSVRTACIEAINTYRQEHVVPLVVCSRSQEYISQSARLILPGAVEIQPLAPTQVLDVLRRAGKSFTALRAAIRSNTVLRDLLSTPLMLCIVMLVYRDKKAKELLLMGTPEEQQRQIFEQYIQCMLKRYRQSRTFSLKQMFCSLTWLAKQMQQRQLTEFHLESLQGDWLENDGAFNDYQLVSGQAIGLTVGSVGGLLMGLSSGLIGWLFFSFDAGVLIRGPIIGLMFGPLFGMIGWKFGRAENIQLIEKFTWSWKKGIQALGAVLVGGLINWLLLLALGFLPNLGGRLITEMMGGSIGELTFMLIFVLIVGFLSMLMMGLSGMPLETATHLKPGQRIRTTGWNALYLGLALLLGVGSIAGLIVGLISGPPIGFFSGMFLGLFFGLIGGLRFGGLAYFQHYLLRLLLVRRRMLPWYTVRLLEEATTCNLLQHVGGGYSFMHPLLQEYFASLAFPESED
jgi:GTPase SAR1 family protein/MFS family permease